VCGQRVSKFKNIVKFQRVLVVFVWIDSMELKTDDKFETRRGNLCVIIDGYKFSKSREMKDENIYFRCTDHNCY